MQSALAAWERTPSPAGKEAIMKLVPGFYQMDERGNRRQFVVETLDSMSDEEFAWIHSNCTRLGCPGLCKALHSHILEGLYRPTSTTSDQDLARMRRCSALLGQWASEYASKNVVGQGEGEGGGEGEPGPGRIHCLPVEVHKLE